MDQPEYFTSRIRVGSYSFVSYSELSPFLDELTTRHFRVEASVADFEPPAAGFSEIAISVLVSGSAMYLASFIAGWASEDAKALRRKLLDVMSKARQNRSGRPYVPLNVQLGRVRFYFHEQLSDKELVERLRSAERFVAALPEVAFEGEPGPGEYGLFWDDGSKVWKGSIYEYSGDICRPEDLWSGQPGNVICPPF